MPVFFLPGDNSKNSGKTKTPTIDNSRAYRKIEKIRQQNGEDLVRLRRKRKFWGKFFKLIFYSYMEN